MCVQVEVAAAHRGRLSLLVNLLGKPLGALCSEMEGKQSDFRVGDVKYHLGETRTQHKSSMSGVLEA
jgi:2-oxoglutarate dehydrogenase complex dehydrogenase (E1) component-like enzyme